MSDTLPLITAGPMLRALSAVSIEAVIFGPGGAGAVAGAPTAGGFCAAGFCLPAWAASGSDMRTTAVAIKKRGLTFDMVDLAETVRE